jgi:uncharacterized protein DUF1573
MSRISFLFIISFGLGIAACEQPEKSTNDVASIIKDSTKFTTIQWQDSVVDFGTKKMGDIVNITFRCTNTGNKPLYLFNVRPGCGCTLVDYTKQPIEPGEQGKIEARFDTNKSHPGTVHKNVFVRSNTSNKTPAYLSFTGTIVAADSSSKK